MYNNILHPYIPNTYSLLFFLDFGYAHNKAMYCCKSSFIKWNLYDLIANLWKGAKMLSRIHKTSHLQIKWSRMRKLCTTGLSDTQNTWNENPDQGSWIAYITLLHGIIWRWAKCTSFQLMKGTQFYVWQHPAIMHCAWYNLLWQLNICTVQI